MKPSQLWLALAFGSAAWAAAPAYTSAGIVNASNYSPGPFAPNSVISIFGTGLAWSSQGLTADDVRSGRLPTAINGVQVVVSGYPAPLFYVSELQINFLMPTNQIAGNVTVRVVRQGVTGPEVTVGLLDAAPALFSSPLPPGYAIAQHSPDYSLVDGNAPAKPGGIIILYGTGLGKTQPYPARPDEIPWFAGVLERMADLRVYLDGNAVDPKAVQWAGLSPGSAGLYQINLKLPDGVAADPEIRVAMGDQVSAAGLRLAVR